MTKIFLCASMNFYRELVDIESRLVGRGFEVIIPVSTIEMKAKNDYEVSHFKGVYTDKVRAKYILTNFDNIIKCDAILVINGEKNGVMGYIGPNVLMEIGLAFYAHKNIYIWNPLPVDASFYEELKIFKVKVIDRDLKKIN